MREFLDILIRGLHLFRVDHMDIMIIQGLRLMAGHPVGIEHRDHLTARQGLIIAQDIKQPSPCAVDVHIRQAS